MRYLLLACALLFTSPSVYAHGEEGHGLSIEKAWARKTSRTVSAAVYLIIRNDTHNLEYLRGVSTDIADNAMIHQSREVDGIMRMDHMSELPIAPGESLAFEPGGYHIMLMGLNKPLEQGDVFTVTLDFENAGQKPVIVEVTGLMGLQQ
ncbi:copper chaperone PCu(A)C [Kordiimonas aestuarii]|uniref:copper chaperone PCu(A)C n=1 Tax=Kordiimonas aestuarii TaxID=1005925 RepID=UPI0021CF6151|nr:copper chaperone PCu(A)C [Kordiimonas aestuarii]